MRHSGGSGDSVANRVVAVMDAFSRPHETIRLTEICNETGLAKATVHRLLQQLIDMEVVAQVDGGYTAGSRLWTWSLSAAHARARLAARPHLESLRKRSGLTVHLGLLHGMDVVYVDKLTGTGSPMQTKPGGREPGHCTALGKAMLAFEGGDRVARMVERGLVARTPDTITHPDAFMRSLSLVASEGIAVARSEHTIGLTCVASPIFSASGRAAAAVSLSGLSRRFDSARYDNLLRDTSALIAQVW